MTTSQILIWEETAGWTGKGRERQESGWKEKGGKQRGGNRREGKERLRKKRDDREERERWKREERNGEVGQRRENRERGSSCGTKTAEKSQIFPILEIGVICTHPSPAMNRFGVCGWCALRLDRLYSPVGQKRRNTNTAVQLWGHEPFTATCRILHTVARQILPLSVYSVALCGEKPPK